MAICTIGLWKKSYFPNKTATKTKDILNPADVVVVGVITNAFSEESHSCCCPLLEQTWSNMWYVDQSPCEASYITLETALAVRLRHLLREGKLREFRGKAVRPIGIMLSMDWGTVRGAVVVFTICIGKWRWCFMEVEDLSNIKKLI